MKFYFAVRAAAMTSQARLGSKTLRDATKNANEESKKKRACVLVRKKMTGISNDFVQKFLH